MQAHPATAARATSEFLRATNDAQDRHPSICRYLQLIFNEVQPDDLTDEESAALVQTLGPAYQRVSQQTLSDGAAVIPQTLRLCAVLDSVAPEDLTPAEAVVVLTLLIPAHSRVIMRRVDLGAGRPVQRFVIA